MMNNNKLKDKALGMPHGTAAGRLKKSIMFDLLRRYGENFCFKCGAEIENEQALSIEHKIAWLYHEKPVEMFFDLNNIAFSHLKCNRPEKSPDHSVRRKVGPEGTAWCTSCQAFIDTKLFAKCPVRWNGYQHRCQPCTNKEKRESRAKAKSC